MPEEKQNEIKAIGSYNLSVNRKKHLIMADDSQFLANSHNILTKHFSPQDDLTLFWRGVNREGGRATSFLILTFLIFLSVLVCINSQIIRTHSHNTASDLLESCYSNDCFQKYMLCILSAIIV